MSHPIFAPPFHQPKSQELTQSGGRSMPPPHFGFQESLMSYLGDITQQANQKMRMEAALEAQKLAEQAQAEQERQKLRELRAEQELAEVPDGLQWIKFEEGFNKEFATVLHIFGSEQEMLGTGPADKAAQSGKAVHARQLMGLFSVRQRDLLLKYFDNHQIPEWLFNGSDQGNLNAQQRILLSSHILVNGTYQPGNFDQRVHAKNCGHWVQTVQNYAGVTANSGLNTDSINGNFDIFGNVVAGGKFQKPTGKDEVRIPYSDAPGFEDTNAGPIDPSESHFGKVERYFEDLEQYKQDLAAYEANPKNKKKKKGKKGKKDKDAPKEPTEPWRSTQLTMDQFDMVKPGDWLYIYNANGSGNHSVIFSRWASDVQEVDVNAKEAPLATMMGAGNPSDPEGREYTDEQDAASPDEPVYTEVVKNPTKVKYRRAITFDQSNPQDGGQAHAQNLGNQFYNSEKLRVSPITLVSKVSPEARPAQILDELFPKAGGTDEAEIERDNASFLAKIMENHQVSEEQLIQWMREDNAQRIQELSGRLTPEQIEMLTEGNQTADLETLVRITSRLRQWAVNAAILAANEEKQYTKENAKYAAQKDEFDALKAKVDAKLAPHEADLAQLHKDEERLEKELDVVGLKKSEIRKKEAELATVKSKISKKKNKIKQIQAPYFKMYGAMPFGQVALGKMDGEVKASQAANKNGKLENLMTKEEMAAWLESKKLQGMQE